MFDILCNNTFFGELNLHKTKRSLPIERPDIESESLNEIDFLNSPFSETSQIQLEFFNQFDIFKWSADLFFSSALCYVVQNLFSEFKNEKSENKTL